MKIKAMALCLTGLLGISGIGIATLAPALSSPVQNGIPQAGLSPQVSGKGNDVKVSLAGAEMSTKPFTQQSLLPEPVMNINPMYYAPVRYDYDMYPLENQKVIDRWNALGRNSGILGDPISYLTCSSGGELCYEEFMGGTLYTIKSSPGAVMMLERPESALWKSQNPNSVRSTPTPKYFPSGFGWPIKDSVCSGDICMQEFQNSVIYSSKTNGNGQYLIRSHPATQRYIALGAHTGIMGYPVTNNLSSGSGNVQQFQNGNIYTYAGQTQLIMKSSFVFNKYASLGAQTGSLGYPLAPIVNNQYQKFQKGAIYLTASGVVSIDGPIYAAYQSIGAENGSLGLPIGSKVISGTNSFQEFSNGKIYSGPGGTQAFINGKAITEKYKALGSETGSLGYPKGVEVCGLEGCYQQFENGLIHVTSSGNVLTVDPVFYPTYENTGGPAGYLGVPVTNAANPATNQTIQRFKGGTIAQDYSDIRAYSNSECDALSNGKSKYPTHNANRVTLAIAEGYGQYSATILNCKKVAGVYVVDWKTPGTVGLNGFKAPGVASGPTSQQFSPTGSYSITEAFGLGNPGTALPYKTLNPNSRWGGNAGTPTYNKYIEYSTPAMGYDEDMWYLATRPERDYQQGAVINYNRLPDSNIVQNAGFAIFLHENPVPTAGCVAIDHNNMVRWLQTATPGDRIIMGVRADLFTP